MRPVHREATPKRRGFSFRGLQRKHALGGALHRRDPSSEASPPRKSEATHYVPASGAHRSKYMSAGGTSERGTAAFLGGGIAFVRRLTV